MKNEAKVLQSCPMCRKHELIVLDCDAHYTLSNGKDLTFPTKVCFCPILADKGDEDCYFVSADLMNWNVARLKDALKECETNE